jgi:hypothetical protein
MSYKITEHLHLGNYRSTMLPCSFKDLEWHKGKKHRHRRLSRLLRGLPVAKPPVARASANSRQRLLKHGAPCALLAPGSSEVASAPLQFLPDHAEKRDIRQRRQWQRLLCFADGDYGSALDMYRLTAIQS